MSGSTVAAHERLQWRGSATDGGRYRARRTFPSGPARATVVLAGPGTVGSLGGNGRDDLLLQRLTSRLVACGAQVLDCDLPVRDGSAPSGDGDEAARADRLDGLLRGHARLLTGPLVLIGFSLGGQALLRLLESGRIPRPVDRLVLVGTVLEEETFLTGRIGAVELVYGSLDLIGYLSGAESESGSPPRPATFGPEMYGEWSAARLIGRHPLDVRVHLLDGLGHTLHPSGSRSSPCADPIDALAGLARATW